FFFFSSRRRHTRSKRDWSSDVCSSDLAGVRGHRREPAVLGGERAGARVPGPPEAPARAGGAGRRANGVTAMSPTHPACRDIRDDLVAVGAGEATPAAAQMVEAHVGRCGGCRDELQRYRALEGLVTEFRRTPVPGTDATFARA